VPEWGGGGAEEPGRGRMAHMGEPFRQDSA